ncbi:hypothetical protein SKAU_G00104440 [Synaphobranchus kaupii]|uniref:Uncharacterized protein n=1 Tax=Synaphobranchus kaupii TaxID=118154 RepID=A0A9Q1G071_SYNKA|nr:hypothetical protein SKAU_G00104440 [Synaphobranchus kaupii]
MELGVKPGGQTQFTRHDGPESRLPRAPSVARYDVALLWPLYGPITLSYLSSLVATFFVTHSWRGYYIPLQSGTEESEQADLSPGKLNVKIMICSGGVCIAQSVKILREPKSGEFDKIIRRAQGEP